MAAAAAGVAVWPYHHLVVVESGVELEILLENMDGRGKVIRGRAAMVYSQWVQVAVTALKKTSLSLSLASAYVRYQRVLNS